MLWSRPKSPAVLYNRLPTYRPVEVERMTAAMLDDGFVLLPKVLTPAEVAEARDRIDALGALRWDHTGATDHYKNVFNRNPYWLTFFDRLGVLDLAERCLGTDCHVVGQTAWRSHPGHHGVGLHLDYLPMAWPAPGVPRDVTVPMFLCTAHFYLSPQYRELCPTHVIPKSHRAGRRPTPADTHWQGVLPQPVLCDAGDVLIFRSDLWHSGSANQTTDDVRYLLQVHYGRREIAQHFAPYLDWQFDPDVVRACSALHRRLLGDHPQGAYD